MAVDADKFKEYFHADLADIAHQLRLMEPVYEKILKISIMTTTASLPQLKDALQANDHTGASRIAHEIKGVYANLRVAPLSELMAEVDARSRRGETLGSIQPFVAQFQEKFDQLKSLL
jgi:HPt (histidine-containing phosphotransfer) domain-containing protein